MSLNSRARDCKCDPLFQAAWPQNGLDMAVVGLPSLWTWLKSVSQTHCFLSPNTCCAFTIIFYLWKLIVT